MVWIIAWFVSGGWFICLLGILFWVSYENYG